MTDSASRYDKTRAALAKGESQAALRCLRSALSYPGPDDEAVFEEGVRLLGEVVEAFEDEELATLLATATLDDPQQLYSLGYELVERGLCGPAAAVLARGVALAPGDEQMLTELSSALEGELRFAEACDALRAQPELVHEQFMVRYLLAFNSILSGRLDVASELAPRLGELEDHEYHPYMRERIERILARSELVRPVTPLDESDLRGWHYTITGGLLTHRSPHGLDQGMNGRYAFVQDRLGQCRLGIELLALVLEAWGVQPPRVYALDDRGSRVMAHAIARRLDLPLKPWGDGREEPGLIVAYDLATDAAPGIGEHRPGQILFAHATCWTETGPVAADITTFLYQHNVQPWERQMRVDDGEAHMSDPDERAIEDLAGDVLEAEDWREEDDEHERAVLLRLAKTVGAPSADPGTPREKAWSGSPVGSNRFL